MTETKWFRILSFIHLIFVLSIVFFGSVLLSGTILFIPALCSAFACGRDLLEHKYNVYDGLVMKFFSGFKRYLKAMRFLPAQLLIILQFAGIILTGSQPYFYAQIAMLVISALLLTYLFYACAYIVFLEEAMKCEEVLIRMFRQVGIVISLFVLTLLMILFFRLEIIPLLLAAGALPVLVIEAAVYYTIKKTEEAREPEEIK